MHPVEVVRSVGSASETAARTAWEDIADHSHGFGCDGDVLTWTCSDCDFLCRCGNSRASDRGDLVRDAHADCRRCNSVRTGGEVDDADDTSLDESSRVHDAVRHVCAGGSFGEILGVWDERDSSSVAGA